MPKSKISINKLIISNPDRTKKFVYVFIFEPTEYLRSETGQIGFLLEMEYKLIPSAEDIIWAKEFSKNLIDFLEKNYYQEINRSSDISKNFENLLQLLNQWLTDQLSDNLFFSLAILISNGDTLYFAQIGNILVYLFQKDKITPLIEFDNKKTAVKFSNIVSGVLETNDQVIFATSNLFDYLSKKEIEELLNKNINVSLRKIKEIVDKFGDKISLGVILIQRQKNTETVEEKLEKLSSGEMVKEYKTHKNENLLSSEQKVIDSLSIMAKSKIKIPSTIEELPEELKIKEKLIVLERPKFKVLFGFLKKIYQSILLLGHKLKLGVIIDTFKIRFNQLSYFRKTLIILLFIFTILFIQSLITFGRQEYKKRVEQKYAILVQEIQNRQNEIAAALIYKDEKKARLLLQDVNTLLNRLPQRTEEQRQLYNFFKEEFKRQMANLYHQEYIESPKILFDLASIDSKIKIGGATKIGDKIYFFNPDNNFIYQIDLIDNKVNLVNKTSVNIGYLKKVIVFDKDSLLFSHSNNGLTLFNVVNKTFLGAELVTNHRDLTIQDITTYLGRLYILDPNNNQIFKYTKTAGGFSKEESWLSQPQNLTGAISIASDGSIYILYENGQLSKFFRGAKQEFKFNEIYPPLYKPIKISTWLDSKYIYILEPVNKRLIILDKNGRLIKQIVSDYFDNLIDYVVNEKEDRAWLFNGTKIFEIKLK